MTRYDEGAAILLVETETPEHVERGRRPQGGPRRFVELASWARARWPRRPHCGVIMRTSRRLRRPWSMQPVVPCLTWSLSLGRTRGLEHPWTGALSDRHSCSHTSTRAW